MLLCCCRCCCCCLLHVFIRRSICQSYDWSAPLFSCSFHLLRSIVLLLAVVLFDGLIMYYVYDYITLCYVYLCVVHFLFRPNRSTIVVWIHEEWRTARPNVVKELRISFIMVSLHISSEFFFFSFICCEHNAWVVFGCCFFPGPI